MSRGLMGSPETAGLVDVDVDVVAVEGVGVGVGVAKWQQLDVGGEGERESRR
jgi:hypothetical protein